MEETLPDEGSATVEDRKRITREIQEMMKKLMLSYRELAELTKTEEDPKGVSYVTLHRNFTGANVPQYKTLRKVLVAIEREVDRRGRE